MYDGDVSRTAPATRQASLQILFKRPTPAIVLALATKPERLCHFWQDVESIAPATQNRVQTSKSGARPSVVSTFDFQICFAPQPRQKYSEAEVLFTF